VAYPGSLASFTTKVDLTDTVLATHVNSLQTEVVAVQTTLGSGILNTTAFSDGSIFSLSGSFSSVNDRIANIERGLAKGTTLSAYLAKTGGTLTSTVSGNINLTLLSGGASNGNLLETKNLSGTVGFLVTSAGEAKVNVSGTSYSVLYAHSSSTAYNTINTNIASLQTAVVEAINPLLLAGM
jgi:hypothetical protein